MISQSSTATTRIDLAHRSSSYVSTPPPRTKHGAEPITCTASLHHDQNMTTDASNEDGVSPITINNRRAPGISPDGRFGPGLLFDSLEEGAIYNHRLTPILGSKAYGAHRCKVLILFSFRGSHRESSRQFVLRLYDRLHTSPRLSI